MWKITVLFISFFSFTILNSLAQERKWRDVEFEKVWSINASENQLYRPGRGFLVNNENIYILDIADNTIKMFDKKGNFLRAFAKKKGAGPGEVRHPTGFDVDDKGNVWISDPSNSRIAIFKNDGSFVKHLPIEIIPYRIAVQPDKNAFYLINQNALQKGKFSIFSRSGKSLKQFGSDIIDDQMKNNIALGGEITTSNDGNLYYTPDYAGLLLGFNSKGNEIFRTKEIVPTSFPKVKFDARGGSWVDRDAKRVSRGIFSHESGTVVIFSYTFVSSKLAKQALDFYDQNTGRYMYSMKLPEPVFQVYLKNDLLYTLRDTKSNYILTEWQLNK